MNGTRNGCRQFPNQNQNNPSPERQQSLSLLPYPRPKHNLCEQLLWSTTAASSSSNYSSTNFPQPTSNSVAMRISALEKNEPLYINAQFGQQQPIAPMSPRSTVFRTKPVLHMNQALRVCFFC